MIFHPRLVFSSQQALTEITYAFLVVAGIFTGLIAFKKMKIWVRKVSFCGMVKKGGD